MSGAERIKSADRRIAPHLERLTFLVVTSVGVIVVGRYLWVALNSVGYPYHLEWMEGGSVETAARLLAGISIYPEPSLDYVGYIYTPFYFVVAAVSSSIFGETLFACRLVSLIATFGTCALLFQFLRREGVSANWAVFAPMLWLSSYGYSGQWFHLARVDSLFVFLLLAALYGMRFWEARRLVIGAAILMWLALLTKQSAALGLFPVGLAILLTDRRRAFTLGGVFAMLVVSSVLVLNGLTDGWFWYYTVEVPTGHALAPEHIMGFWRHDVWRMAPLVAVSLPAVGLLASRKGSLGLFYGAALIGALATSWLSRLHSGGVDNVLMPTFLLLCLLAPLGLSMLDERLGKQEREQHGYSPTAIGLVLVIAGQLAVSYRPIGSMLPDAGQYARGAEVKAYLEAAEGEVLMPDYRWLPREAGQSSFGLGMAAKDLLRLSPGEDRGRNALRTSMSAVFAEQRFSQVILSDGGFMRAELGAHYCYSRPFIPAPDPLTGWFNTPAWVWLPRRPDTVMLSGDQAHECPENLQNPTTQQ